MTYNNQTRPEPVGDRGSSTSERTRWFGSLFRRHQKDEDGRVRDAIPEHTISSAHKVLKEPLSLWDRAYDDLKAKDHELVENFEGLLLEELSNDGM